MYDYKLDKSPQKTWVRDSQPKDKPLTTYQQRLVVTGILLGGLVYGDIGVDWINLSWLLTGG